MNDRTRLTPLSQTDAPFDRLGAFDTEGDGGQRGFLSGVLYLGGSPRFTTDPREFVSWLYDRSLRGYRLYAHNLTYDYGVLLPWIGEKSNAIFVEGDCMRVSLLQSSKNRVTLLDSLSLLAGLPLAAVGQVIGLPKLPTPPSLRDDGQPVPEWTCERHNRLWCLECYNSRDAEIVYHAVSMFYREIYNLGGQVRYRLASTAMDLYRRAYLAGTYLTPFPYRNDFARQAYYGGRVEPFVLGPWEGVSGYDFTSLYPSVMVNQDYPDPNSLVGPVERPPAGVIEDFEGFSQVTVNVPRMHLPPLPVRSEGKLYFPTGKVTGTYAHSELRYALSLGVKVCKVHQSLYSRSTISPFQGYVNDLFDRRQDLKDSGDPRQLVYKVLLNSLYGKFGMRSGVGLYVLRPMGEFFTSEDVTGWEVMVFHNKAFARRPVPILKPPAYVIVPWAAYVTAWGRVKLHRSLQDAGQTALYCDTDSIFTTGTLPETPGLGGLKLEWTEGSVDFFGPKLYHVSLEGDRDKYKVKGVPSIAKAAYLETGQATYQKPLQFWEAFRRGLNPAQWVEVTKQMRNTDPKRDYHPLTRDPLGPSTSSPWSVRALGSL